MSRLEEDAKQVLLRMFRLPLRTFSLSEKESRLLGTWAFKTALMINAASNYRKIVPDHHYEYLFLKQEIPEGVFIDLGFCPRAKPLNWIQTQTLLGISSISDRDYIQRSLACAYNIVIALTNFLIRIIYIPFTGYGLTSGMDGSNRVRRLHPALSSVDMKFNDCFEDCFDFAISDIYRAVGE